MKNYLLVFCLLGFCSNTWAQLSKLEQAKQNVAFIKSQKPSLGRDTSLALALYECGRLYSETTITDSTNLYIARADTLAKQHQWKTWQGIQEYRAGNDAMTLGLATTANEHFLKALRIFQEVHDTWRQSQTYNYLGVNTLYNDFSDTVNVRRSIKLLERAYMLAKKGGFSRAVAGSLVNMIQAYQKIGEYQKALSLVRLMPRNFAGSNPIFPWTTMAVCHAYIGDMKGYHQYVDSIASRKNLSAYERYYSNFEFANLALHFKNAKKAEQHALEMDRCATEMRSSKKMLEAQTVLYQVYKAAHNPALTLYHLERVKTLSDSIAAVTSKQAIEELQLKYNTERIQSDNERVQQARTQKFLLAGIGLLVLFSLFAFWSNHQLRKKNLEIIGAQLKGQTLERQRVAADLHDNLGSTLSALHWNLEAMDNSKLSPSEQAVYATIRQQVGQAYKDVRLLSHNLLPDELAKQGLAAALQNLVNKMNRNTAVHFELTGVETLPRLDRQTEFELYSICLELLNNILKHANATESRIDLTLQNGMLHLTVGDNGKGLNGQRSDGRGMQNVAARIASQGGTWNVDSELGGGVQNRIMVPV